LRTGVIVRVIARLDIKNEFLIKGIQLEGLRKLGDPKEFASNYYSEGIDEIIIIDAVASLYERNGLFDLMRDWSESIFCPITIVGGIRSVRDVDNALQSGADKVAINTAAIKNINLITEIAHRFGSQCILGSIEAKRRVNGWECFVDNGREPTGLQVSDWIVQLENAGAGEILITSVDQDGTNAGIDIDLLDTVLRTRSCPLLYSGGFNGLHGDRKLLKDHFQASDALVVSSQLHYGKMSVKEIKRCLNA
jgi:cyclase